MSKKQLLQDYYDVCELCKDDISVVAKLIHKYHVPEEKLGRIESDLEEWIEEDRISHYGETLSNILDAPYKDIKLFVACNSIASLIEDEEIIEVYEELDDIKVKHAKKKEAIEHFVNPLFEGYE